MSVAATHGHGVTQKYTSSTPFKLTTIIYNSAYFLHRLSSQSLSDINPDLAALKLHPQHRYGWFCIGIQGSRLQVTVAQDLIRVDAIQVGDIPDSNHFAKAAATCCEHHCESVTEITQLGTKLFWSYQIVSLALGVHLHGLWSRIRLGPFLSDATRLYRCFHWLFLKYCYYTGNMNP